MAAEATKEVTVIITVIAPAEATHYFNNLLDNPVWLKRKDVAGGEHWWWYCKERETWMLQGHSKPHWAKEIT